MKLPWPNRGRTTGSENRASQKMKSPAVKTPPAPLPNPPGVTERIRGGAVSASDPFTGKAAAAVSAWVPRPSAAAFPAASAIDPPSRVSAEAPTPIPSESESPDATA